MKQLIIPFLLLSFSFSNAPLQGQSMKKKAHTVTAEIIINAPAEAVWQSMVLDYGQIGNFSPYIYSSGYEAGSLVGEVGAERKCSFDPEGKQWIHERIAAIDSENMVMRNVPINGAKLPMDFDNTQAYYRVKDNGDGTSTASYELQLRTKPAFLGVLAKGNFRKQLEGTLIGLKHFVETGQPVTPMNHLYDEIRSEYLGDLVSQR